MGYIGVQPKAGFTSGLLDRFTSTTGTTVTLTHDIASENDIIVFVNFVKQDSTNYSVGGTGNKTLTLGGTLVSSDVVEVHYINTVKLTQQPSANSVGITELNVSDGSNGQVLKTNGSGTLSFANDTSGKIGQVVNTTKTDTFSTQSSSYTDITNLSASITPSASSSKILVILSIYISGDTQTANLSTRIARDSTALQETVVRVPQEGQAVYRLYNVSMTDFDSPSSTSILEYKAQAFTNSGVLYVNRSANQGGFSTTSTATLTLMEVLA